MTLKSKRGQHRTLPKELKSIVALLEKEEDVTRVILGPGECARHRHPPGRVRVAMPMPGGVKARAYSGNGVMDLYIYCDDPERIAALLERWSP